MICRGTARQINRSLSRCSFGCALSPFTLGPFLDLSCTPRSNSFCELNKITLRRRIHSIPLTASKVSPPRRSKRSAHIMYKRPPNAASSRLHPVSLFYDFWCSSSGPPLLLSSLSSSLQAALKLSHVQPAPRLASRGSTSVSFCPRGRGRWILFHALNSQASNDSVRAGLM